MFFAELFVLFTKGSNLSQDLNAHYLIDMLAVSVSWSIEACRLMFPFGWSSPRSSGLGVKIFAVTSSSSDPSLSDLDSDGGA